MLRFVLKSAPGAADEPGGNQYGQQGPCENELGQRYREHAVRRIGGRLQQVCRHADGAGNRDTLGRIELGRTSSTQHTGAVTGRHTIKAGVQQSQPSVFEALETRAA